MRDSLSLAPSVQIHERLGEGSMGVVYRATTRHGEVALKTLQETTPRNLLYLKREFRTLMDISHPNLVELDELVIEEGRAYFTMELVNGPEVADYVRPHGKVDYARIQEIMLGLARGLACLHSHGKRHGDIKPSNLRLSSDCVIKLLDFGLSSDSIGYDSGREVEGTLPYLAPEAFSTGAGRPADMFALGAVAFELLTQRHPFPGPLTESLLARKRGRYGALPEETPNVLRACVEGMLRPDSKHRWTSERVVEVLGDNGHQPISDDIPLVGRESSLSAMASAFAIGRNTILHVVGPSGIGKSSLAKHFLSTLGSTWLLSGRCHPNERVPFGGIDAIVDAVVEVATTSNVELPAAPWLSRIFPTTTLVTALPTAEGPAPLNALQRAMSELANWISILASQRSVVFWLDDVQWAPQDTGKAMRALLSQLQDQPGCHVLLGYRSEPSVEPFLEFLRVPSFEELRIEVPALTATESASLVSAVSGNSVATSYAAGNPYILIELARSNTEDPSDSLVRQLESAPETSQEIVRILCLAGRPVSLDILTSLVPGIGPRQLHALRKQRVLRPVGERWIPYHDMVRTFVVDALEPSLVSPLHNQIADLLIRREDAAPDWVLEHLLGAERNHEASEWAMRAASRAESSLAFADAAKFFKQAIDLAADGTVRSEVLQSLGTAHSHLGHGLEAAAAFDEAARLAETEGRTDRMAPVQQAADAYIKIGEHERGRELLSQVLDSVGVRLPQPGFGALSSFLLLQTRLHVRGFDFCERAPDDVQHEDRLLLDALFTAAHGLVMTEPTVAQALGARFLLEALRTGSAPHIAAALSGQASFEAALGGRFGKRARELVEQAQQLSTTCDDKGALAISWVTLGTVAWLQGNFHDAVQPTAYARELALADPRGSVYTVATADVFWSAAQTYLGEFEAVRSVNPERLEAALARGNLFAANQLRQGHAAVAWLADDQPDLVESMARDAMRSWDLPRFTTPRYHHLLSMVPWALYVNKPEFAVELIEGDWKPLKKAQYLQLELPALELRDLRARAHLGAAQMTSSASARATHLRIARRELSRLDRSRLPFGRALGACGAVGLTALSGEATGSTEDALSRAALVTEEAGLHGHHHATRVESGLRRVLMPGI